MNRTSLFIIIIVLLYSCGREIEINDKTVSLGYVYDYSDGKLSMVKHFIQVDSMRYLNQYIRFDDEGNLQKHLSHYFTLISFKDTIKQNETTTIRIELDAPKYFGGMKVIIGNYDRDFILPDDMVLDTIYSEENSFVVFYDLKIHQLGDTIIRGCILNFQEEFHNGEVLIKERPLYFSKHFFVQADN